MKRGPRRVPQAIKNLKPGDHYRFVYDVSGKPVTYDPEIFSSFYSVQPRDEGMSKVLSVVQIFTPEKLSTAGFKHDQWWWPVKFVTDEGFEFIEYISPKLFSYQSYLGSWVRLESV